MSVRVFNNCNSENYMFRHWAIVRFSLKYLGSKPDDGPVPKHVVFWVIVIKHLNWHSWVRLHFPTISSLHTQRGWLTSKKYFIHFCSPPDMSHVPPVSFSSIWHRNSVWWEARIVSFCTSRSIFQSTANSFLLESNDFLSIQFSLTPST
jgi:hypothetical protein